MTSLSGPSPDSRPPEARPRDAAVIRPLARSDRPAVQTILEAVGNFSAAEVTGALEIVDVYLDKPGQQDYVIDVLARPGAVGDGAVLGYSVLGPAPFTDGTYDLYWLAVHPDAQRTGAGRRLMAHAEDAIRARGGRLVLVETASKPSYAATRAFYERIGYQEIARVRDYYARGDDKIIYAKALADMAGRGRTVPVALTIAGSDPSGGAGIQADLKTFAAFGVYGASVVTALTAQNTRGVSGIHEVPATFVALELEAVLGDIGADAVKTGMLASAEIVEVVAAKLAERRVERLVVDPVLAAKSGDRLLRPDAEEALKRRLLPLAAIVTPNAPEAEALAGFPVRDVGGAREAARRIAADFGARAVLVKGGHLADACNAGDAVDVLWDGRELRELRSPRHTARPVHGTGCTLASAIAAGLALGRPLFEAVSDAKAYVARAIERSYPVGGGLDVLDHRA